MQAPAESSTRRSAKNEISCLTYIHRFVRFPHIIFQKPRPSPGARRPPFPPRERIEVRVSSLSNPRNPRSLRLQPWNSRRTHCSSVLIRRHASSRLNSAKPERLTFIDGKRTGPPLQTLSLSTHLSGATRTLSI